MDSNVQKCWGSSASLSCRGLVVDVCVWSGGGYCASVYRRRLRYSGQRAEVGGGCWSLGKARNHDVRATHHPRDGSNRGWRRFSSCRRLGRARGWFVWFFHGWLVRHRRPRFDGSSESCCGLRRKMSKICDLGVACCEPFGRSVGHSSCPRGLLIP